MMSRRGALLALILTVAISGASAQQLSFERITVDEGLSGNWVRAILQDRHGFLWLGTQEGLNRYDGYDFEVFRYHPGNSHTLSDNAVTILLEDRDGRLWVGTNNGLNRFEPATQTFAQYGLRDGLRHTGIRAAYQDRAGEFWVGTDRGLHRWDPEIDGFIPYPQIRGDDTVAVDETVTAILEDSSGRLWIGTQEAGLAEVDRAAGGYRRAAIWPREGLSDNVAFLHEDVNGYLWTATWADAPLREGGGLHRLDTSDGSLRSFYYTGVEAVDLPLNISAIAENADGTFWLTAFGAPAGGLHRFDPGEGTFVRYAYDPRDPTSLSWGYATALHRDRSGIVWVGTSRGLNKLDQESTKFGHYKEILDDPYDLRDNVYPILEDEDGLLWLGIDGPGGLVELDRAAGRVARHLVTDTPADSVSASNVFALADGGDGILWIGGSLGLYRFDRRMQRITAYRHDPSDEHSLPNNNVMALRRDARGALWIGTENGLARLDDASGAFATYRHDPDDPGTVSGTKFRALYEDEDGYMWAGTNVHVNDASGIGAEGLSRIDPATGEIVRFRHDPRDPLSLSNNGINVFYQDASGTLWIGTDNGLNRFDAASGTFRYYLQDHGLPSAIVLGILGDDEGNLWLSTQVGLSRFEPAQETFKNFGREDGIRNRRFNVGSYHRGRTGEMFFGGPSGLNYFYPERIVDNPQVPPVAITAFRLRDGAPRARGVITELDEIVLGHRENAFSFEFAALSFRAPARNRYAFKLEGFDREWVQAGTRRYASYTNLRPGTYTFRVRGSNNDGVWNEEGASVRIRVRPPWWRTTGAYLLYGLFFAGAIVGADRYQRRRLLERERENAREREREKARELERAYEDLKRTQAQLVQQEKLASLGQLTAGIAHEIKNPLNFVNNFAQLNEELARELRAELTGGKAPEVLEAVIADIEANASKIAAHGRRADGIVRSMLEHSRGTKGERRPTDVNLLVDEYANLAFHGMRAQSSDFQCHVQKRLDPELPAVEIVPQEIGRVLLNLLTNAFQAVHDRQLEGAGGVDAPLVEITTVAAGAGVEIRIRDNGTGIPDEAKQRIFDPFFTTKSAGQGTGLGLSLSHDIIVNGHRGTIQVESEHGEYTEFVIGLPVGGPSSTAARSDEGNAAGTPPHATP